MSVISNYTIPGFEIYVAIICILIYCGLMFKRTKKENRNKVNMVFIALTGLIGISGVLNILYGIIELIGSKASADSLGRESSPYQLQLAFAGIGSGIVGTTTLLKPGFMIPAMITKISMSFGMAYSIFVEFIKNGTKPKNEEMNEIGITLFWSLFIPIIILLLFGLIKLLQIKAKKNTIKSKMVPNASPQTPGTDATLDIGLTANKSNESDQSDKQDD